MSDVQDAIEELVNEQVESRIDDAISENHEMNSIRDDISEIQAKLEGDLADEVASKVLEIIIDKLKKEEGQNWGREPPFSFYKNMKNFTEINYLQGQVIGILSSIEELKKNELALILKKNEVEDKIEELKKEDA